MAGSTHSILGLYKTKTFFFYHVSVMNCYLEMDTPSNSEGINIVYCR